MTPPRVPEVRSVQEYIGPEQPVLMDQRSGWPSRASSRCCTPTATEVPKFRISPDYYAKLQSTDTWQDGINGVCPASPTVPAGFRCRRTCRGTGARLGSLRRFDTIVDAELTKNDPASRPTAGCISRAGSGSACSHG